MTTDLKRALEALRSGVPNRYVVRALGSNQQAVEDRFKNNLSAMRKGQPADRSLLVLGGFGAGKSHLLEYLQDLSVSENFVCSRIVVSKETPLYDPGKVFKAAIDSASIPGISGRAMQEIALKIKTGSDAYGRLEQWAGKEAVSSGHIFAATLFLYDRLNNDPELTEDIVNFWSGEPLPLNRIKKGLKQLKAVSLFNLKRVPAAQLAFPRFRFAARLIRAAGFAGWVLLIDEVELIGRYSLLQRGKAYAELARWLGGTQDDLSGITCVAAITEEFQGEVLEKKEDMDKIGPRLRAKGSTEFELLAERAEMGMRIIEKEAIRLKPPDNQMLEKIYGKLKQIHGEAYGWHPEDVPSPYQMLTTPMRTYVRRWINEWDLRRIYPNHLTEITEDPFSLNFAENVDLVRSAEANEGHPTSSD